MTSPPLATQQRDDVLTDDASGGEAGAAGEFLLSGDNDNVESAAASVMNRRCKSLLGPICLNLKPPFPFC